MAEFKRLVSASLGGTTLLLGAANAKAANQLDSVTFNSPTLGSGQSLIANYYIPTPVGTGSLTSSSANFQQNAYGSGAVHVDDTYGLSTYAGDKFVYPGDPHGTPYMPGQSFTTGSQAYKLASVGYTLGDPDVASSVTTSDETITLFKINSNGTATQVGSYTASNSAGHTASAVSQSSTSVKNTQFTIDPANAPTLDANTTYAFTVTFDFGQNVALLIPTTGNVTSVSGFGVNRHTTISAPFNPGGTSTQQLVNVSSIADSNGGTTNSVLTYSGYTSRNNSSSPFNNTAQTNKDYQVSSADSTNIGPQTGSLSAQIGIYSGNSSFGIDQTDFYVIGTVVVPEPATLSIVGLAGTGLLARRRRKV